MVRLRGRGVSYSHDSPRQEIPDQTRNVKRGIRCGSDILALKKIFSEPCLKLSPGRANEVDAGTPPDVAQLSPWQVERALASLSEGEKIALMKVARLYARKTPYDKEDLIQEAFARVLSGRRAWTNGTGPVLFLGGVIRSIAWEWKSEGPLDQTPSTDLKMEERNANAAIDAAKIVVLFDDDPVARNMVAAMMDGARGEELQAISRLGKVAYESKRTKIRRRVEKFFDAEP